MNKRSVGLAFSILLFALSSGCGGSLTKDIQTQAVVDPHASFSEIRSYTWLAAEEVRNDPNEVWVPGELDPGVEIKRLIDEELRGRGWSESATPQVFISFLVVNDVKDIQFIENERGSDVPDLVGVGEGALIVEMIDASTQNSIWLGAAMAETQSGRPTEDVKKRLRFAVSKLFSDLPR